MSSDSRIPGSKPSNPPASIPPSPTPSSATAPSTPLPLRSPAQPSTAPAQHVPPPLPFTGRPTPTAVSASPSPTPSSNSAIQPPRRLGRGLEALLGAQRAPHQPAPKGDRPGDATAQAPAPPSNRIPISQIKANPFQPRKEFKPEELQELQDSLKTTGLLQPITVRRAPSGNGFELAAGERRLRAATNLGWTDIPASITELSDRDLLAVALIENLQRSDLNPIEEAQGYERLLAEFGQTQQGVADLVGKDRSTVANMLRLLQLPPEIRTMVQNSALSLGHARALLSLPSHAEMLELAKASAEQGLSVREVERRVRDRKPTPKPVSENRTVAATAPAVSRSVQIKRIEDQLRRKFQTDARLNLAGTNKGTISISFYSADDLERLLDIMLGAHRDR